MQATYSRGRMSRHIKQALQSNGYRRTRLYSAVKASVVITIARNTGLGTVRTCLFTTNHLRCACSTTKGPWVSLNEKKLQMQGLHAHSLLLWLVHHASSPRVSICTRRTGPPSANLLSVLDLPLILYRDTATAATTLEQIASKTAIELIRTPYTCSL